MSTRIEVNREDELRLHVLLAECKAVRIDESRMTVHGLSDDREHSVKLNAAPYPEERYLKAVRELLSSHAINSPGGYPVFLKRWTRMGQLDSGRLSNLLKLGEPEAVVAVASSKNLTADVARLAWWAHPEPETARFLLENEAVRSSGLGVELADFLVEFLPFETEPTAISSTVRLILGTDDPSGERARQLWRRGQRKTSILVGFIRATPFDLPDDSRSGSGTEDIHAQSIPEMLFDAEQYELVSRLLSERGSRLFETCARVLERPADQDMVVECLEALSGHLRPIRPDGGPCESIEAIDERVHALACARGLDDCADGEHVDTIRTLWFLSLTGEPLVRRYFAHSSTVGSLMRRQLAPILDPVGDRLRRVANVARRIPE